TTFVSFRKKDFEYDIWSLLKNQMGGGLNITMNCTSSTNIQTWLKRPEQNVSHGQVMWKEWS
ncbi:hypothetical protein ACO1MR_14105, partial [Staphylococcus aureus]